MTVDNCSLEESHRGYILIADRRSDKWTSVRQLLAYLSVRSLVNSSEISYKTHFSLNFFSFTNSFDSLNVVNERENLFPGIFPILHTRTVPGQAGRRIATRLRDDAGFYSGRLPIQGSSLCTFRAKVVVLCNCAKQNEKESLCVLDFNMCSLAITLQRSGGHLSHTQRVARLHLPRSSYCRPGRHARVQSPRVGATQTGESRAMHTSLKAVKIVSDSKFS